MLIASGFHYDGLTVNDDVVIMIVITIRLMMVMIHVMIMIRKSLCCHTQKWLSILGEYVTGAKKNLSKFH